MSALIFKVCIKIFAFKIVSAADIFSVILILAFLSQTTIGMMIIEIIHIFDVTAKTAIFFQ